MTTKITLKATTSDRRAFYGLLFESETVHRMTGKGLHNRSFPHRIQVWVSKRSQRRDDEGQVVYRDCSGNVTTQHALTFNTSAESVMIASTPVERDPYGADLAVGDVVELEGFGRFVVTAKPLHDPILVPVD